MAERAFQSRTCPGIGTANVSSKWGKHHHLRARRAGWGTKRNNLLTSTQRKKKKTALGQTEKRCLGVRPGFGEKDAVRLEQQGRPMEKSLGQPKRKRGRATTIIVGTRWLRERRMEGGVGRGEVTGELGQGGGYLLKKEEKKKEEDRPTQTNNHLDNYRKDTFQSERPNVLKITATWHATVR